MLPRKRNSNGTLFEMGAAVRWALVPAFCLLLIPGGNSRSEDQIWTSGAGLYRVSYVSDLDPIEINRMHSWVIHVETANGTPLEHAEMTLEGGMPEHDHGLPTKPLVTEYLGGGNYLVEGMRFHMSGDWEITVAIRAGDDRDTCELSLQL